MKNNFLSLHNKHKLFLNYALIGISGVAIDLTLYWILVHFGTNPIFASIFSVSAGIVNNFLLNALYNFKRTDHLFIRFLSFYAVGATGIILSALFIYVLHDRFGLDAIVAKAISVPFIVIFQYWFNKNASFAQDHRTLPWKQFVLFLASMAAIALFVNFAPYGRFVDEYDNLLGAQMLTKGEVLYKDYFSHHMPLVYFITAPFMLLFSTDLIAIRVAFNLVLALWLLALSRHIYKHFGLGHWVALITLITLLQIPNWSHMLLAESFIQFCVLHAVVLFSTRKARMKPAKDFIVYSLLGAIISLSSAPYAPLALLIYGFGFIEIWEGSKAFRRHFLRISPLLLFSLALPYVAFLGYLTLTHSVQEFQTQALQFNSEYYAQFTSSAARTWIDSLILLPTESLGGLYEAITFQNSSGETNLLTGIMGIFVLASIFYFYKQRQYENTIIFSLLILLTGVRHGFTFALGNDGGARSGVALVAICIIMALVLLASIPKIHSPSFDILSKFTKFLSISFLLLVFLLGISATGSALRELQKPHDTGESIFDISPDLSSVNTIQVVNLVAGGKDYYWIGPFDFGSQLYIKAKNSSKYRFYLPWHEKCTQCTDELISDILRTKPSVIVMAPYGELENGEVWGNDVKTYTMKLRASYSAEYYEVSDPRLDGIQFRKDMANKITPLLETNGYDTTPKEAQIYEI